MSRFADSLRNIDRDVFIARFGGIYEHSPWVAATVFDAGWDAALTLDQLTQRMAAVIDSATQEQKLALLRAHPELAGKLALAGGLTAESQSEQASAGLDACTAQEFEAFQRLNADYHARFRFPFIIAVRGLHRAEILSALRARVGNPLDAEFQTALREVHKIARLRLEGIASQP